MKTAANTRIFFLENVIVIFFGKSSMSSKVLTESYQLQYLEAKVAGIAMVNAFLNRADPDHRQDRSEGFFPSNPHIRPDMIK